MTDPQKTRSAAIGEKLYPPMFLISLKMLNGFVISWKVDLTSGSNSMATGGIGFCDLQELLRATTGWPMRLLRGLLAGLKPHYFLAGYAVARPQ